jgi:hypothetical protein
VRDGLFIPKQENLMRHRPIHCKQGHEYNAENTLWCPRGTRRNCRICSAVARAKYSAKIAARAEWEKERKG